jgi:hypothetical protein
MVIFGAGASYDSAPSQPSSLYPREQIPVRLPLATELFLDKDPFAQALNRFPQCHPIVPYLQSAPNGVTIEQTLESLQSEAEKDPERKRQLAAIRYYLQSVIWECEDAWQSYIGGPNNYKTLLDQLRRSRRPEDAVCLVTFNYDRMIERALPSVGVTIETIPQYIEHDTYKLFKLHGSVHWGLEVDTPITNIQARSVEDVSRELIQRVEELNISTRFRIVTQHPVGKYEDVALFPAIAIPVETKPGFVCPEEHLACLREYLPRITKIIAVGWRGAEQHFLTLLKKSLSQEVSVCVVAGTKKNSEEVIARIQQADIQIKWTAAEGGFTDFIVGREAEKFLRS